MASSELIGRTQPATTSKSLQGACNLTYITAEAAVRDDTEGAHPGLLCLGLGEGGRCEFVHHHDGLRVGLLNQGGLCVRKERNIKYM